MKIKLKDINELYNYTNIKEYITINEERGVDNICNYKIKCIYSNKPNYQIYTKNNGIITLAYSFIPDYLDFYIIDNVTLVKVISHNNGNQSNKNLGLSIDIKSINNEFYCNEDEETQDTCYDD